MWLTESWWLTTREHSYSFLYMFLFTCESQMHDGRRREDILACVKQNNVPQLNGSREYLFLNMFLFTCEPQIYDGWRREDIFNVSSKRSCHKWMGHANIYFWICFYLCVNHRYMMADDERTFFHVSSKRSCSKTDSARFQREIKRALNDLRSLFLSIDE